jgi:hypothetical protein
LQSEAFRVETMEKKLFLPVPPPLPACVERVSLKVLSSLKMANLSKISAIENKSLFSFLKEQTDPLKFR